MAKEFIKNINNESFSVFLDLASSVSEKQTLFQNISYYTVMHKLTDQITVVEKGSGYTVLNENKYSISTGDIIFIPKGTSHTFHSFSKELMLMHYHTPKTFIKTDLYEINQEEV